MIKVMIVDDERNIREGIVHLVDWSGLGCEVASSCTNGAAALQRLQSDPVDIVVTDIKMPGMDGIELSRRISEEYKNVKVIILTAYSDFALAKQAIKYNVADFIVKNDFMEELPNAVKKTIHMLQEEREKAKGNWGLYGEEDYTQLFQRIMLTGGLTDRDVEKYQLDQFHYSICACEIDYYDQESDRCDLIHILNNILKISLKDCSFHVLPLSDNYCIIIIRYPKTGHINLNTIIEYFNNIIIMVEEFMRIDIRFGLSRQIEEAQMLETGYQEAKQSLSGIMTKGCEIRVYSAVCDKEGQEISCDVDWYVNRICELTFDEESEEAQDMLRELYERLSVSCCTFEQCQLYMLVICSSVIHKALRYHIDVEQDFNKLEKNIYVQIQDAKTMFSLVLIGNDTIERMRKLCIGKKNFKNELVKKVDDCIRAHYQEEITLQYISNVLYLNSSYLSRTYKKLTGNTITEKISMYRVAKAKDLLSGSSLKIYEVAKAVGIQDAAYFTNVFMKYAGQSPTEYRQEHS